MQNFRRALKLALLYRGRLAVSLVCALIAAGLWGANIGALYPVLQLVDKKKNLQDWVDAKLTDVGQDIAIREKEIDEKAAEKHKIEAYPPGKFRENELHRITEELSARESRLASLRATEWRYQQLKHHVIRHLPPDMFETLAILLSVVVLITAIRGFFEFWQEYLVGVVVAHTILDLRSKFYRAAVHQDLRQIQEGGSAELMSRFTNDMEAIANGMKILFGKVVAEPLKAIACFSIALWISWQLTLLFVLIVPLAVAIMTLASKKMKKASRRVFEKMGNVYKILQETFQGLRVVKAFTMEPYERRRFHDAAREYAERSIRVTRIDAITSPLVEFTGVLAILVSILVGAYLVMSQQKRIFGIQLTSTPMEMPALMTLYAQLLGMADPIRKLSSVYTKVQSSAAAADRVFAALDRVPQVQANPDGPRLDRHCKEIEFQNVCFSYTPDRPVLTNVCLRSTCSRGSSTRTTGRFSWTESTSVRPICGACASRSRWCPRTPSSSTTRSPATFATAIETRPTSKSRTRRKRRSPTTSSWPRVDTTCGSATSARRFPAGRSSGSPWPGPSSATRASWSWTSSPARSTRCPIA
jgi:ATP-binding cassette subfamily B protein/subfamily B ATP-binding cassette protein MsbA